MKTRIARDVATARRPGRPIPAAMGTAGWAQAEADRARVRTVLRAPSDWKAPATTSVPRTGEQAETIGKHGISGSRTSLPYLERAQASFGAAHDLSAQQNATMIQAKLKVSEPGDIYEQEADRISGQVLATPAMTAAGGAGHIRRDAGQPTVKRLRPPPGWSTPWPAPATHSSRHCGGRWSSALAGTFRGCACISARLRSNRRGM